ncbi:hypothetical protein ACHMWL_15820 [Aeromonas caviae]|nr:hypothetical protein [Aeromonas hydrophila]MCV9380511.1 hypothetical protein [Aeromonas hydrophila]
MSASQLQAELTALLGELEVIDLCPQERRALVDRIQRMMPDKAD